MKTTAGALTLKLGPEPRAEPRHRAPVLLPEVPALQQCCRTLTQVVHREGRTVEQERNDRFPGRNQGPRQLFLPADQVQVGAVAHMF